MVYLYIQRAYGKEPIVGNTVQHTVIKKYGVIAREKLSQGHYVMVKFDGEKHASPCHPDELDYSPPARPAPSLRSEP